MSRDEAIKVLKEYLELDEDIDNEYLEAQRVVIKAMEQEKQELKQEPCEDMGEVSDGYHTFNQLYHQRAVLFATIVNNFKHYSWKSLKHEDNKYCFDSDGKWFIVGIDTPKGSYTYHYETDKYWNMFDCEVLKCAKHWDGHTEEDVTRLLSLEQEPCDDCISRKEMLKYQEYLHGKMSNEENHKLWEFIKGLPSVTPQEPNTWSLDDAREDFMSDVYNTLDFLPTNDEANQIIDSFDSVASGIRQEPILNKIRTEIEKQDKWLAQAGYNAYNVDIAFNSIKRVVAESEVK